MQSIVVYAQPNQLIANTANLNLARSLLNSLLNEYLQKSSNNTNLIQCLFNNLRLSFKPKPSTSPSHHTSSLFNFNLINKPKCAPLYLITAYSGYSKDTLMYDKFLQNKYKSLASSMPFKYQPSSNSKSFKFGDDAWFIAKQKYTDVLGVADGVGGWHEVGIDPSKFSFNLMKTCKRYVEQEFNIAENAKNINAKTPISILKQSYNTLLENKNNSLCTGSSTACIIVFQHDTNLLHTANLGDSGFVVIRNKKIIYKSQEQQHYFNSPFQMAILPDEVEDRAQLDENVEPLGDLVNDSPDRATTSSFKLSEGDFIVVATDGLWDNLTEEELLKEIEGIKSFLLEDLEKAANSIAQRAVELSMDPDYLSPFALAARQNGININGEFFVLFFFLG